MNISDTILKQPTNASTSSTFSLPSMPSMNSFFKTSNSASNSATNGLSNFTEKPTNMGFVQWFIIMLIIGFTGFAIYVYLKNNNYINLNIDLNPSDLYTKLMSLINYSALNTKDEENANISENNTPTSLTSQKIEEQQEEQTQLQSNTTINDFDDLMPQAKVTNNNDYQANEASSSVHLSGKNKSGWCYIGEDKGFRSCAKVGVNDECMSGNIFPTKDICVNPNLR